MAFPPNLNLAALDAMSDLEREETLAELAALNELLDTNPLQGFHCCPVDCGLPGCRPHPRQHEFMAAQTGIVAAFAGNRFGKTTALTARFLVDAVDEECLPERLRQYKRWNKYNAPRGTFLRIVNPSFGLLDGVILPAFRQWAPREQLLGGNFDKAFQGAPNRMLRFKNGSWIQFMTYEQDVDKFGGSALHGVGYDEPPPRNIRDECLARTADFNGYEAFAMTPLKANTGWVRRDIYRKREDPGITVVRGSIHDNPAISEAGKEKFLGGLESDIWRKAREFGDFVDVGGLIYADFERCVVDPPSVESVRRWDVVVGMDPGLRNAAFVWVAFDSDGRALVFDEMLLQDRTPADYVVAVALRNARWQIGSREERNSAIRIVREGVEAGTTDPVEGQEWVSRLEGPCGEAPAYVIDPSARNRSMTNAESVESQLNALGVYPVHGQNQVEAGIQQVRTRLKHKMLLVADSCAGVRDEADEYAAEDRADGEFKPIKDNDHRLDALRYAVMERQWDIAELEAPDANLGRPPGYTPDHEPPWSGPQTVVSDAPLGALS